MRKILTVLGTRPQIIKSKPLSNILKNHRFIEEVIVNTGQHYDYQMYGVFLKELNLPKPKYCLDINKGSNASQVSRMISRLMEVIESEKPNLVVVYGDTNSTLAGAMAAKRKKIPLAHIEAGMRSFNMDMPEELNRVITDSISDFCFVSVKEAMKNIKGKGVYLVGDVLYDVLKSVEIGKVEYKDYVLLTLHRAERLESRYSVRFILDILSKLNFKIVFLVHPNTKEIMEGFEDDNVICLEPQPYLKTLSLIKHADMVITDSGGIQREAYMLKTLCVTLRAETEWKETLDNGWNKLAKYYNIYDLKVAKKFFGSMSCPGKYKPIFGNGKAAQKIVKVLERFLRYEHEEDFMDIPIDTTHLVFIADRVRRGERIFNIFVNVHKVIQLNNELKELKKDKRCVFSVDGKWIEWLMKGKVGYSLPRFGGLDVIEKFFSLAGKMSWRIYLLGSERRILSKVRSILFEKFSKANVVGTCDGFFPLDDDVIEDIKEKKPDILFIALPSPRKELFGYRIFKEVKSLKYVAGVGGAFDIIAGKTKRAPKWMQNCGLEWFYRCLQDRKLFKRYYIDGRDFLKLLIKDKECMMSIGEKFAVWVLTISFIVIVVALVRSLWW